MDSQNKIVPRPSALLASSAELGWSSFSAELRTHGVSEASTTVTQHVEIMLVVDGNPDGLVKRTIAGLDQEAVPRTGGSIGKVFGLPTVISTSFAEGPNGLLISELAALYPDIPVVPRPGEINAWDNPDFVAAVKATKRKNLIIAGVSTEVCLALLSPSAVKQGFGVYAVIDASGTWNKLVADVAIARMVQAGVVPITWLAVGAELQRDWRRSTGQPLGVAMSAHLPFASFGRGTYEANQKRGSR